MRIYFINIIFIIFIACNSSDNNAPGNDQFGNKAELQNENIDTSAEDNGSAKRKVTNIIENSPKLNNAEVPSISELWNTYKKCKAEAETDYKDGDIQAMVKNFAASANAAIELSRDDLAAWQLNNIGHYSIEEFTQRTDYQERVRTLAIMKDQTQRDAYYNETKQVFKQNYHLLKSSEPYLKKAKRLDRKYKRSDRTDAIKNNLSFIKWVKEFLRK
ncbi:hypothetical protein MNBD_IGNAVI01-330 [hydrothermal vent metagenome]|uniref:Lipoprotein n=1 Tax=hydrothermal vent metagenome TaxID=652676 RepID=A0A3B1DBP7_9ZZZZ